MRMENDKVLNKIETGCQTVLRCSPHFLNEDEVAIVQTEVGCQTAITSKPEESNTDLYNALKFVESDVIVSDAVRQIRIPRRTRLHFKVPEVEATENDSRHSSDEGINSTSRLGSISSVSSAFEELGAEGSKPCISSILKKTGNAKQKPHAKTEEECQTNLMVSPHILNKDENAVVSASLSVQTSVTCLPDSSLSELIPKLESYAAHDGQEVIQKVSSFPNKISFHTAYSDIIHEGERKDEESLVVSKAESDSVLYSSIVFEGQNSVECASIPGEITFSSPNCTCDNTRDTLLPGNFEMASASNNEILSLVTSMVDKVTTDQGASLTIVQNLLGEIIDGATKYTPVVNHPGKDLIKNKPKSIPCACAPQTSKIPNIKVNIFMNKSSSTKSEIRAKASVAFSSSQCSIKSKTINHHRFISQNECKGMSVPEIRTKPACDCAGVSVKYNDITTENVEPEIFVNVIRGSQPENISMGTQYTQTTRTKCNRVCLCSISETTEIQEIVEGCEMKNTDKQDIRTDENFNLTCKCPNLNKIVMHAKVSTTSCNKTLQTSVLGCNEETRRGTPTRPSRNASQVASVTSRNHCTLPNNNREAMMESKETLTNSKSVKQIAITSKPIHKITIGIGPAKPDASKPGALAIPLKVILNRDSGNQVRTQQNITVKKQPGAKRKCRMQEMKEVVRAQHARCRRQQVPDTSATCNPEPSGNQSFIENEVNVQEQSVEVFNRSGPSTGKCAANTCPHVSTSSRPDFPTPDVVKKLSSRDKCTVNTCPQAMVSQEDYELPWDEIQVSETDFAELETTPDEVPELPEPPEDQPSKKGGLFGCCGGGEKESPYALLESTESESESDSEPEPEPEPVQLKMSFVYTETPYSMIEPYILPLLHSDSNISISSGVSLDDVTLSSDVVIEEAEKSESEESVSLELMQEEQETRPYPCPSKHAFPLRIHPNINLQDSRKDMNQPMLLSVRRTQTIIPLVGQASNGRQSLYTIYHANSCYVPSVTLMSLTEKPSTFLAAVSLADDPDTIERLAKSETNFVAPTGPDRRKVNFQVTRPFSVSTPSAGTSTQPPHMNYGNKRAIAPPPPPPPPPPPSAQEQIEVNTSEVLLAQTIILTEELNLALLDSDEVYEPCNMAVVRDPQESIDTFVPCAVQDPNGKICRPCGMQSFTTTSSSVTLKEDPVMLALIACERELKPIKEGLNTVRFKLQNLNMPELDCIFNKENDVYSLSRTTSWSAYNSKPSTARYTYPYCCSSYYSSSDVHPNRSTHDPIVCANSACFYPVHSIYQSENLQSYSEEQLCEPQIPTILNRNIRLKMRINNTTNNDLTTTINRTTKVRLPSNEIPSKMSAPKSIECYNALEECEAAPACPEQKKSHACQSNVEEECPFLEALKAVVSVLDTIKTSRKPPCSTNCKNHVRTSTSGRIRMRFRVKPSHLKRKKK